MVDFVPLKSHSLKLGQSDISVSLMIKNFMIIHKLCNKYQEAWRVTASGQCTTYFVGISKIPLGFVLTQTHVTHLLYLSRLTKYLITITNKLCHKLWHNYSQIMLKLSHNYLQIATTYGVVNGRFVFINVTQIISQII